MWQMVQSCLSRLQILDLGTFGGFVSGYFLNSTNIAALSIPSFEAQQGEASYFDAAIIDFITTSQKANMKKIVIDLQSNYGGSPLMATDRFKRFFPNINAFQGSRLRAHPAANVMGNTITEYGDLITNEWVATTKIIGDCSHRGRRNSEALIPSMETTLQQRNDMILRTPSLTTQRWTIQIKTLLSLGLGQIQLL
jgi:hypothetical protein